jgi:chromosomal replication initiator protein
VRAITFGAPGANPQDLPAADGWPPDPVDNWRKDAYNPQPARPARASLDPSGSVPPKDELQVRKAAKSPLAVMSAVSASTPMPPAWDACLAAFQRELTPQQYVTWIQPLACRAEGGALKLTAPNRFVLQWVRERFGARIGAVAAEASGGPVNIEYAVADSPPAPGPQAVQAPALPAATPATAPVDTSADHAPVRELAAPPVIPATSRKGEAASLNPSFNFASFVSGKANQLARAAGLQVADHPTSYNPLFVYGGVGLGKTHLIQAIGNHILVANPAARIRYIHAETYVSDVVRAYQHKAFDEFKRNYRSLDLLLIDDIQFFGGKSRTQEEFFYLFNTLIEAHKQVVITCDTYPKEIAGIEERLISRFGWGLTVALEPPELEMRVAILLAKAQSFGLRMDEQVAFFIAKHIRSNVRELEGALKRVLAYSNFHGQDISLALAKDALRDLLAVQNRQISIENIQKTVADYYKIRVSDMHSKKRSRAVARPRQVAMALANELTQMSLPEIGSNFGGRDHTTVLHACRQVAKLRESLPDMNHDVNFLLQVLRS